ncbi:MAG: choice-of-anchor Q domain-containing protein [Planctomycetota bacterium]
MSLRRRRGSNQLATQRRRRQLARGRSRTVGSRLETLEDRRMLATVTVGNTLDLVDGDTTSIANLIATPGADGVSLREAIEAANATAGADTITFDAGVFGTPQTINITSELAITDELTITGPGQSLLTIDAQLNSRVLNFTAAIGDLSLSGLTLTGGQTTSASPGGLDGGGVRFASSGTLEVLASTVTGNSTGDGADTASAYGTGGNGGSGGGIATTTGNFVITNSTVSGNSTGNGGDGYYAGQGGSGGGIATTTGNFVITNSTISGNSTGGGGTSDVFGDGGGGDGGGVFLSTGQLNLIGSTLSGNSGFSGGGLNTDGVVAIESSTITDNNATLGGGGVSSFTAATTINNSIVAGNTAGSSRPDIREGGNPLTINHSLIGVTDGLGAIGGNVGNVTGTAATPLDPLLGPLQNSGGPTLTHAPELNSPAINAGTPAVLNTSFDTGYVNGNLRFQQPNGPGNGQWTEQGFAQVDAAAGTVTSTGGPFDRNMWDVGATGGAGGVPSAAGFNPGDVLDIGFDYRFTLDSDANRNLLNVGFRDEGPNVGNGFEAGPQQGFSGRFRAFNDVVQLFPNLNNAVDPLEIDGALLGLDPAGGDLTSDDLRFSYQAVTDGDGNWTVQSFSVRNLATGADYEYTGPEQTFAYTASDAFYSQLLVANGATAPVNISASALAARFARLPGLADQRGESRVSGGRIDIGAVETNGVLNSSFEADGGSLRGWTPINNAVLDNTLSFFGANSAQVGGHPNGFSVLFQGVSVDPGEVLTVESWVNVPSALPTGEIAVLKVEFYELFGGRFQEPGEFLSETEIIVADDTTKAGSEFGSRRIAVQAPAGAVEARIVLGYVGTGGAVRFDSIGLTRGSDDHAGTFDAATPAVVGGDTVFGNVQFFGDADYFSFTATAGEFYRLVADHSGLNSSQITLYDTDGVTEILTNDSERLSDNGEDLGDAWVLWRAPADGTYFAAVREIGDDDTGSYRFEVDAFPVTDVADPSITSGRVNRVRDAVLYRLPATVGVPVSVVVGDEGIGDPALLVYDTDGATLLASDAVSGSGAASLVFNPPASGDYFIEVRDRADDSTGSFNLAVGEFADDNGDAFDAATVVPSLPSTVPGVIETLGDVDYFEFFATQGVTYNLLAASGSLAGGLSGRQLTLHDTDGVSVLVTEDSVSGGGVSQILWEAPANGFYFVAVREDNNNSVGAYTLSLGPDADDHGDDALTATPVAIGSTTLGEIRPAADVDYFSFTATAGEFYRLATDHKGIASTEITLYDTDGVTPLASRGSDYRTTLDDADIGEAWVLWRAPADGTYYAAVRELGDDGAGFYELFLDSTPVTLVAAPVGTTGSIDTLLGNELFAFTAYAGRSYTLTTANLDTTLTLYDTDGVTIVASDDQGGPGNGSLVSFAPTTTGIYHAEVRDWRDNDTGSFTIDITVDADLLVTNTDDAGPGSLRQAILDANAGLGSSIAFGGAVFLDDTPDVITLTTGDMAITGSVSIYGPGADRLTIDAGGQSRHFHIDDGTGTVQQVTIDGLTLENGSAATSPADGGRGGSIAKREALTLNRVHIANGFANVDGGAIWSLAQDLTINESTISGSQAAFRGGAIYTRNADLTITNSTLSGNSLLSGFGNGGAIQAYSTNVTLESSTVTNNSVNSNGGGLFGEAASSFTLINSIVAGNTAGGSGNDVFGPVTSNFSLIEDTAGAESILFQEDFESYTDTAQMQATWGSAGAATLDATLGNPGKSANHLGGVQNQVTVDPVIPSAANPVVYTVDIYDDGGSANRRMTAGLRSSDTANIFEMGMYNNPAHYAVRAVLPGPSWVAFTDLVDDSGTPIANQPVAGWHTFQLVLDGSNATFTLDLNGDGNINSTLVIPVDFNEASPLDTIRLGTGLSSLGGGANFDNFLLTGFSTNNVLGQSALLGPLQHNGGPTPTHALEFGSPALDAGGPTPAPIHWYRFEGDATDSAGTNDGVAVGGQTFAAPGAPGVSPTGAGFTNNGAQFVELTQPLSVGTGSSTVEAWVNIPAGTAVLFDAILGNSGSSAGTLWGVDTSGVLRFNWNDFEVVLNGSTDVRDGTWRHVAFVRDVANDRLELYVDGVLDAASTSAGSNVIYAGTHRIGNVTTGLDPLAGTIDELAIYDAALTPEQISERAAQPPGFDQRGPGFDRVALGGIDIGAFEAQTAPVAPLNPGDFNGDGRVDNTDLNLLLANWGSPTVPPEWINGLDGAVDNDELNALLRNWGFGLSTAFSTAVASDDEAGDEPTAETSDEAFAMIAEEPAAESPRVALAVSTGPAAADQSLLLVSTEDEVSNDEAALDTALTAEEDTPQRRRGGRLRSVISSWRGV